MKKNLIILLPLLILTSCKAKVEYKIDKKYAPLYSFSLKAGEEKLIQVPNIKIDKDVYDKFQEEHSYINYTEKVLLVGKNTKGITAYQTGGFIAFSCKNAFKECQISEVKILTDNGSYYSFPANIQINFNEQKYEEEKFPQPYVKSGEEYNLSNSIYQGLIHEGSIYDFNYPEEVYFIIKPAKYFKSQNVNYTVHSVNSSNNKVTITSVTYAKFDYFSLSSGNAQGLNELEYTTCEEYSCNFPKNEINNYSAFAIRMKFIYDENQLTENYGCDVNFDVTINGERNTYSRLINVYRNYN